MLFKLSLSNIRKSLRDYAIYFFTLIIGVSVFYVFNAIGGQAAMMEVSKNRGDIIELLTSLLSGVSVFVAGVLGLLIIYASRFLMKRRNKEFALYMMLGMGKGKISAILLMETIIIGIGSLGVGLIVGIGLSQLMSLRYGTVPIVRETGGLKDTVEPYNEYEGKGTGFSFANYNAHEMLNTIRYAKDVYYNRKREWNKIIDRGMAMDFSWKNSAKKYEQLYDRM